MFEPPVPLADGDADGCVCDEYGALCDWGGDHVESEPDSAERGA